MNVNISGNQYSTENEEPIYPGSYKVGAQPEQIHMIDLKGPHCYQGKVADTSKNLATNLARNIQELHLAQTIHDRNNSIEE